MNNTPVNDLPHLSDESIDRIEAELFTRIAEERTGATRAPARVKSRARRRWITAGSIAAAFALGILVAPPILNAVSPTVMSDSAAAPAPDWSMTWSDSSGSGDVPQMAPGIMSEQAALDGAMEPGAVTDGRDIIASGHASVQVDEIAAAADEIADIAAAHGGYVESTNVGETTQREDISVPVPPGGDYGWVTIRVPADSLSEAMSDLADVGEVRTSSVTQQDVTMHAIDLRARVETTRASVARLTELMSQTASVTELIEAEVALSERQAQLESYEQQLAALDDQVAMSSLHVELSRTMPVTQADPAGFGDGLKAGWNGLIVSLNALVIAVGFLLPWIAVLGVVSVLAWLLVRFVTRSRRDRSAVPPQPNAPPRD